MVCASTTALYGFSIAHTTNDIFVLSRTVCCRQCPSTITPKTKLRNGEREQKRREIRITTMSSWNNDFTILHDVRVKRVHRCVTSTSHNRNSSPLALSLLFPCDECSVRRKLESHFSVLIHKNTVEKSFSWRSLLLLVTSMRSAFTMGIVQSRASINNRIHFCECSASSNVAND